MDFFDRPPPAPLPAARIRALYAQNPTTEVRKLAWEICRLQRVVVALEADLRSASTLRHRQDILDRVAELRESVQREPCLNEALAVKQGRKRGEVR
jgi:type II secretory pathway component PulJ